MIEDFDVTDSIILDKEILDDLFSLTSEDEQDLEFLDEILSLYKEHTPPIILSLEQAIVELDFKRIKSLAHRVKGSSRNIGAIDIAQKSEILEYLRDNCKDDEKYKAKALELWDEIDQSFHKSCEALERYLHKDI